MFRKVRCCKFVLPTESGPKPTDGIVASVKEDRKLSQPSVKPKSKNAKAKAVSEKKSKSQPKSKSQSKSPAQGTRTKLAPKTNLKRLKTWKQIADLDFTVEDWPAYRQSLSLRAPLTDWNTVWADVKTHPLNWAAGEVVQSKPELAQWLTLLGSTSSQSPAKPMHARQTLDSLKVWAESAITGLQVIPTESDLNTSDSKCDSIKSDEVCFALEAIAAAWLLPLVSSEGEADEFRPILDALLAVANTKFDSESFPVQANLLNVELPLTLYFNFPDLAEVVYCSSEVAKQLSAAMEPCLDGNGMPTAGNVAWFPLLVASWTRVYQLSKKIATPVFIDSTDDQYQWSVRQYLRMMRSDGSLLLSNQTGSKSDNEFVAAMLTCNDDLEDWQAALLSYPNSSKFAPANVNEVKESRLPDAADETEWGKLAVLRSKWKAKSDKLAVDFSGRDVVLELENHRQWLSGPMQTELRINGTEAKLDDTWSEVCWHSDDDCVYLEIQNELDGLVGLLQRQFLISRHYRFLLIADSVLLNDVEGKSSSDFSIDHHWAIPLADKVSFEAEKETHEGRLLGGKHQLSVLPLTLPEWRVEFSRGSLSAESHQLRTHYSLPAGRLFQSVLIDLDHRRSRQPLTWRQLTVGEGLEPVTLDNAAGFRVQLDRMQFLIYRSLAPIRGRTLLGHNYYCDFYAGQFQPNGFCEDILMINGPEDV